MAYMNADTTPKVGYRPYLQTNPRGASMLSGVRRSRGLGQGHPFDPWRLHGLGQYRPFDQDPGGWLLHGLSGVMDMDPSQASDPAMASTISSLQQLVNQELLTANEADSVLSGNLSLSDAMSMAANRAPGAGSGPLVSAQYSQNGSQLIYTASWPSSQTAGWLGFGVSADGVIGKMQQLVPEHQMSVDSTSNVGLVAGNAHIRLNITDHVGHQFPGDIKGILDSLMQQVIGPDFNPANSTLSLQSAMGTPQTVSLPPGSPADALTWIEGNWKWLAIAAGALIVLGPASRSIFGGRR